MNPTQTGLLGNGLGGALLASLFTMDPATINQFVGYLVALGLHVTPVQATAGVALIGMVLNQINTVRAHNAQPPLQANELPRNSGSFDISISPLLIVLAMFITACLSMSGCTTLQQNPQQSKLFVQIATMKVIEADKAHTAERAAKIREVANEGKQFLDTADVSVPLLETAINTRLAALNLQPSDRVLASALVDAVVAELNARVGAGLLSPEQRMTVSQVFESVIQATEFYAQ